MKLINFHRYAVILISLVLPVVGVMVLFQNTISMAAVFTDDRGRVIRLTAPPRRIVAMAPSLTEILYYLGLKNRVVGVTKYSYYPVEAKKKPNIGTYINVNVENSYMYIV